MFLRGDSFFFSHGLFLKRFILTLYKNDQILDWSKWKAIAENKINVNENLKFGLGRVETIVGKGQNAGYQHFFLFPLCFQKPSVSGSSNVGMCGKELINSSPNHKTLHWSKFKALADDTINVAKMIKFAKKSLENFVGKREKAGYQHFPFSHVFKGLISWRS